MERKLQLFDKESQCKNATTQKSVEFWVNMPRNGPPMESVLQVHFGTIMCHMYNAVSENSKAGMSEMTYHYHEKYGFTEMNYIFYDERQLYIKMVGMENMD